MWATRAWAQAGPATLRAEQSLSLDRVEAGASDAPQVLPLSLFLSLFMRQASVRVPLPNHQMEPIEKRGDQGIVDVVLW